MRLISSAASSSSRRARALACSATCFCGGAKPRPGGFPLSLWVCMASPVDGLREHDSGHDGDPDDEERAGLPGFRLRLAGGGPELWPRRRETLGAPGCVRSGPPARAWARRSGSASACAGRPRRRPTPAPASTSPAVAVCRGAVGELPGRRFRAPLDVRIRFGRLSLSAVFARGDARSALCSSGGNRRPRRHAGVETRPEQLSHLPRLAGRCGPNLRRARSGLESAAMPNTSEAVTARVLSRSERHS